MKKISLPLLTLLLANLSFSQDLSSNYVKYIDTLDLRKHLTVLASDEFEGRQTAAKGQKKSAAYIKEQFEQMHCASAPGKKYFQQFKLLKKVKSGEIDLGAGKKLKYPQDFGFNGMYQTFKFESENLLHISGKNLMSTKEDLSDKFLLVEIENYKAFNQEKVSQVKCKGMAFIVADYDARYFTDYNVENLALPQKEPRMPYLFLNKQSLPAGYAGKYFKASLNPKPAYVSTENVIGFVEGSDAVLKNEIIVISAHYDHLGMEDGKVFNGADDNGSGTCGLLEIAQAFQQAKSEGKNPKRSILFIALTGEEMGLLGSSHYVSDPFFPLSQTITDLNIDMIGRTSQESEKEIFSVYVIGSNMLSDDLHQTQENANKQFTHLNLDYKYNDVNEPLRLYYRSDHYNFAKNGIPSIFYFGGFHDDYHQETDEISKINFEKIKQISTLVFHTAWMLGNAEHRPIVNH